MDSRPRKIASRFALLILLSTFSLVSEVAAAVHLRNPNDNPMFGDGVPGERFGTSVVVEGTTAAVGSFAGSDAQGNPTGSVRVFTKQDGSWTLQAKLLAPDPQAWTAFGTALALEGDTLIVGASNARNPNYQSGAVHVYERDGATWTHSQMLSRPEPLSGTIFGAVLALAGDTLVVSSPLSDTDSIEDAGSVTVFERDAQGWQPKQTIAAPQPFQRGMFGAALVFAGDELLVGAYGENSQAGAAYSFARVNDAWVLRQRIVGSQVAPTDWFGASLAADDARLLIGAPAYLQGRSGYVVEWKRKDGRWVESATILPPANEPDLRHFGFDIAHRGGDSWFIGAEQRASLPTVTGIDLFTYQPLGGALGLAARTSVPYVGRAGYALDSLATDGTDVFLGLPSRVAPPWSNTGEVLVVDPSGSQSTISAGATATTEYFGSAMVANSRWLLVGAPGERRASAQAGAVLAYDLENFATTPAATVLDVDGESGDSFGTALALSGDVLLVGSARDDSVGSVQTYEYLGDQWLRTGRWTSPNPGILFGSVLAADAAAALVGAPYETTGPVAPLGAAYVYERDGHGWLPPTRLTAAATADNEHFGESVAVDGNTLVVGSLRRTTAEFGAPFTMDGVARVFEKDAAGWTEVAQLLRPDPQAPDGDYGKQVAVAGATIFVAAVGQREVHVFRRQATGWVWSQRIEAPASSSGAFGDRIRAVEGELWVGAPDHASAQRGSLHRFSESDGVWRLAQSLHAATPQRGELFGADFAVDSKIAYIGAPSADGYAPFVRRAGRVDVRVVNAFGSGFEE